MPISSVSFPLLLFEHSNTNNIASEYMESNKELLISKQEGDQLEFKHRIENAERVAEMSAGEETDSDEIPIHIVKEEPLEKPVTLEDSLQNQNAVNTRPGPIRVVSVLRQDAVPNADDPDNHCNICDKTYATVNRYRQHLRYTHKMKLKRKQRTARTKTSNNLSDKDDPTFYCRVCKKTFLNRSRYRFHLKGVHKMRLSGFRKKRARKSQIEPVIDDPNFYCRACKRKLISKYFYQIHLVRFHNIKLSRFLKSSKSTQANPSEQQQLDQHSQPFQPQYVQFLVPTPYFTPMQYPQAQFNKSQTILPRPLPSQPQFQSTTDPLPQLLPFPPQFQPAGPLPQFLPFQPPLQPANPMPHFLPSRGQAAPMQPMNQGTPLYVEEAKIIRNLFASNPESKNAYSFTCSCDLIWSSQEFFLKHLQQVHHLVLTKDRIQNASTTRSTRRNTEKEPIVVKPLEEPTIICRFCKASGYSQPTYRDHLKEQHTLEMAPLLVDVLKVAQEQEKQQPEEKGPTFHCKACNITMDSSLMCMDHFRVTHNMIYEPDKGFVPIGDDGSSLASS